MSNIWNPSYLSTSSFELHNPKSIWDWNMKDLPSGSSSCGSATSASRRNSSRISFDDGLSSESSENFEMMKLIPDLWSDSRRDIYGNYSPGPQHVMNQAAHFKFTNCMPTRHSQSFGNIRKETSSQPFVRERYPSLVGNGWGISSTLPRGNSTPSIATSTFSYPSSPLQEPLRLNDGAIYYNNNANHSIVCHPPQSAVSSSMTRSDAPLEKHEDSSMIRSYPLTEENLSLLGQQTSQITENDLPSPSNAETSVDSCSSISALVDREKKSISGSSAIRSGSVGSKARSHKTSSSRDSFRSKKKDNQLYKTEMCVQFQRNGYCPYGSKCQFAHGEQELKRIKRCENWKTKPCINWMRTGTCRYGKRCCFKHGDEDNGTQLVNEPPPAIVMKKISMKLSQKGYYHSS